MPKTIRLRSFSWATSIRSSLTGTERFCLDAACAGVDGLIVVDLPTEEATLLAEPAATHGLDIIRLVAPTTDDKRLPIVLQGCSGFVYYVSITGVDRYADGLGG